MQSQGKHVGYRFIPTLHPALATQHAVPPTAGQLAKVFSDPRDMPPRGSDGGSDGINVQKRRSGPELTEII